jgi:phosphatidylinositol glycan class B
MVVRLQSSLMMAGFLLWLLVYEKQNYKHLLLLALGILCALFIGMLADRWFYGRWVFTAVNYFRVNVLEGRALDWGVMPWWDYFGMCSSTWFPPCKIWTAQENTRDYYYIFSFLFSV